MDQNDNQPRYRAYTVIPREGQNDFWAPIGAAFSHRDGLGFNVLLQALPINGKIVLRPAKEKDPVGAPE
jgi:hypothetical protein